MDYVKDSKDFKGIPFKKGFEKRDYYVPEKTKKDVTKKDNIKENRKTGKDYEEMAKLYQTKFYEEYRIYPYLKRKSVIMAIKDKNILNELVNYEKEERLKFLIKDKLK